MKYVSVKLGLFYKIFSRDDFETPLTQPFVYTAIQLYSSGNFEHSRFRFCVALLTGGSVGIFMFSLPLFPQYHCFSIQTHCSLIFFLFQTISYPVLSYDFAQEMSGSTKPHKWMSQKSITAAKTVLQWYVPFHSKIEFHNHEIMFQLTFGSIRGKCNN